MLTGEGCHKRVEELLGSLEEEGVDGLLINRPQHLYYLSGFLLDPRTPIAQSLNFLYLASDGTRSLVTFNWAESIAQSAYVEECRLIDWYTFRAPVDLQTRDMCARAEEELKRLIPAGGNIGVELDVLPARIRTFLSGLSCELREVGRHFRTLRSRKQADELETIKEVIGIAQEAHSVSRELVAPGITELELWGRLEGACHRKAGAPVLLFGDVISGPRAGEISGLPTPKKLSAGELLILDLYPLFRGYRADITNTLVVGTEPTALQQEKWEALKAAMEAGERALCPGNPASAAYVALSGVLRKSDPSCAFPHHAGHGVGLDAVEDPFLVHGDPRPLQSGQVVTLEPAFYEPGIGGMRMENMYLITDREPEKLSHHVISLR